MDESGRDAGPSPDRAGASICPVGARESGPRADADGPVAPGRAATAPARSEGRVASLSAALRRARIDNAERSSGVADLRGAEIARLDILREQLEPILAQVPRDCDLFDLALSPGERPRLFIDALGFVEMGHDRRSYRFLQDTRHGRLEICASDKAENIVDAITAYIAHRLVEREKALASDFASGAGAAQAARAAALRAQPGPAASKGLALPRRALEIYLRTIEALVALVTLILLVTLAVWAFGRLGGAAP